MVRLSPLRAKASQPLKRSQSVAAVLLISARAVGTGEEAAPRPPLPAGGNHRRTSSARGGGSPGPEESALVGKKLVVTWGGAPVLWRVSVTMDQQQRKKAAQAAKAKEERKAKVLGAARAAAAPLLFFAGALQELGAAMNKRLEKDTRAHRARRVAKKEERKEERVIYEVQMLPMEFAWEEEETEEKEEEEKKEDEKEKEEEKEQENNNAGAAAAPSAAAAAPLALALPSLASGSTVAAAVEVPASESEVEVEVEANDAEEASTSREPAVAAPRARLEADQEEAKASDDEEEQEQEQEQEEAQIEEEEGAPSSSATPAWPRASCPQRGCALSRRPSSSEKEQPSFRRVHFAFVAIALPGGEKLDKGAAWPEDPNATDEAEYFFDEANGFDEVWETATTMTEARREQLEAAAAAAAAVAAAVLEEEEQEVEAEEAPAAAAAPPPAEALAAAQERELVESLRACLAALSSTLVVDETGASITGLAAAFRDVQPRAPKEDQEQQPTDAERFHAELAADAAARRAEADAFHLRELEARERFEADGVGIYACSFLHEQAQEQEQQQELEEIAAAEQAELRFSPRSGLPLAGGGGLVSEQGSPTSSACCEVEELEGFSDGDGGNENESDDLTVAVVGPTFDDCCLRAVALANAEVERALALGPAAGVATTGPSRYVDPRPVAFLAPAFPGGPLRAVSYFDFVVPIFGGRLRVLVTRPAVYEL